MYPGSERQMLQWNESNFYRHAHTFNEHIHSINDVWNQLLPRHKMGAILGMLFIFHAFSDIHELRMLEKSNYYYIYWSVIITIVFFCGVLSFRFIFEFHVSTWTLEVGGIPPECYFCCGRARDRSRNCPSALAEKRKPNNASRHGSMNRIHHELASALATYNSQ